MRGASLKNLLAALALLGLIGLWGSGVMMVESGEQAVVYRFGAVDRIATSGLAVRLPWPIEQDERVRVTEVRRVEIDERRLLTGDTNLIDLTLVVQYTISDAGAFATALDAPESTVAAEVESAASETVSEMEVDLLFTTGRSLLEQQVRARAQARLDALGSGIALNSVDVRDLAPPPAVVDAFNDVSSARGDKETLSLSADAYASKILPDARGQAAERVERARGEATALLARADSEIARFEALAEPHASDPRGVKTELYRGLIEEIAPRAQLVGAQAGSQIALE